MIESNAHNFNLQNYVLEHISQTKKLYLEDPNYLLEHYELENSITEEYEGRQILEMLQNADDAAKNANPPKVIIKLKDNILTIANNGEYFSKAGLISILYSNLSPKYGQKNQIGNKGKGFRSILNWTKKVNIFSANLRISFSKEISIQYLEELIQINPNVKDVIINRYQEYKEAIAVLRCPELLDIDKIPSEFQSYDTIIEMEINPHLISDIEKQIDETVDAEMMLFLNHLLEVEVCTKNKHLVIRREELNKNRLKLIADEEGKGVLINEWNIHKRVGVRPGDIETGRKEKNYELSLAWQDDLTYSKNLLHSFFKTDVVFPFPGILHGTFELSGNRNELIRGPHNHNIYLFKEVAKLFADVSQVIAESEPQNIGYKPMTLVSIDFNNLGLIIRESGFERELKEEIKKRKIFPVINNEYVRWDKNPAYYTNRVFPDLLSFQDFPYIMKYCDTEHVVQFILSLGKCRYKIDYLFRKVFDNCKTCSFSEYAKIVLAIHDILPAEIEKDSLPPLLYDSEYFPLEFKKEIFIPKSDKQFPIPSEVGIQIIHPQLASALQTAVASFNKDIKNYLNRFQLKEYVFTEIIELLIKNYITHLSLGDIKKLNSIIFNLYKDEINPVGWYGTPIPMITKTEEIAQSKQLYLGKNYGYEVPELLYHYNMKKIVANPQYYIDDEKMFAEWEKYLVWAGVAKSPRYAIISAPKEFALYSMKVYDFRNSIRDYPFRNYQHFIENSTIVETFAESIDDLENILSNNSTEAILFWLANSAELVKKIESDFESDESYISIKFNYARNLRTLPGRRIKNYIKWKLATSHWVKTETGKQVSPNICTTSHTIGSEFSPFLEKPKIDYDLTLFRENKIRKDKVDYLMKTIGVHESISSVSTHTLYAILLRLLQIDPEGKKAKSIYREIAINYDEQFLDEDDFNYKQFMSSGKVFCKSAVYESIKNVFYLDSKRYGESVINQFSLIEIERRRGKDKIKKIFGVKPLEEVTLELLGKPQLHSLYEKFIAEMDNFKSYVYAYRQGHDVKGNEINLIKNVKFILVKELTGNMVRDGNPVPFEFVSYEYLYLREAQTIYINTPDCDSVSKLKEQIPFCTTISECFSSLLDIDTPRMNIRELFSKSYQARDEIIRTELEDIGLEKLNAAKIALGIITSPKLNFWNSFIKCFPGLELIEHFQTDEEILKELNRLIPNQIIISEVFYGINYDYIGSEESAKKVAALLTATGISITQLNQYLYPPFDITESYKTDFENLKRNEKIKFKEKYHIKCQLEDSLRKDFLNVSNKYSEIQPTVSNDLNYDVHNELYSKIYDMFNIDIRETSSSNLDLNDIYNSNRNTLLSLVKGNIENPVLINQYLDEEMEVRSLLYFEDEINTVAEMLLQWLSKHTSTGGKISKSKKINFGTNTILFNDYVELANEIDNIIGTESLNGITLENIKVQKSESPEPGRTGQKSHKAKKSYANKDEIGFLGEYLVYKFLLNKIDKKESIKWVSGYSRLCGVNDDGDDLAGYDFEYIPNNATHPRFIEVKVVGYDNSFHISSNEVKVGEKHKDRYEVFLVRNIENPLELKIEKIQGIFNYKGRSFSDNDYFSVVNDNFILKFKKIEEGQ